ncbi:MAG: alpha-amylase [Algicola sp.]|nr:alpha-amylase [Algicola sp.]
MKKVLLPIILLTAIFGCKTESKNHENQAQEKQAQGETLPFMWEGANLYFLMTDRFNNGDKTNDLNFDRTKTPGKLRGFQGGDLKGITQKIEEGYFTNLGINAIWMTPVVEQIHGATDEGTGVSYGFHGYWAKDWTTIDPNFGTAEDLRNLVDAAHERGIRIVLDAVINHTGPVTEKDPVWPNDWVRTEPQCQYSNYENTITCTLVKNLPDIKTESNEEVDLPPQLIEKWKAEGRLEQEMAELDAFFEKTGHPRAPRFYIMKWLSDYITDYGIDGYRCDTVKHTEEFVWEEFKTVCDNAFAEFKANHPDKILDDSDFYLVGEVYNYGISGGKYFDFGDKKVNYYDDMFTSQINFEYKWNAQQMPKEALFQKYDSILHHQLKGYTVLNYLSSHDDGQPFDAMRQKPFESANLLMLTPGGSQVYYGDESARVLKVDSAQGDANLRSAMNWKAITNDSTTRAILNHWQKLGQFREQHPAIGAGKHRLISESPYLFSRELTLGEMEDVVLIGLDLKEGQKTLDVSSVFSEGNVVYDAYSNQEVKVSDGKVVIDSKFNLVLLELKK